MANFLNSSLTVKTIVIGAGAACGLLAGSMQDAGAAAITLGTAADYGLLVGTGQTLTMGGGLKLTGDIGVGKNDTVNVSGSNTVTGNGYMDSNLSYGGSGSVAISGTTYTQSMSTIITAANNASIAAGALTGTAGLQNQGGSINLTSGQSLTIKALTNLSENVLNISALSLTSGTLTFDDNGYSGAKFIINVTGNFTIGTSGSIKSLIKGINGASGADIIFNIEGTGNTVSLTGANSTSMIGTILAPSRNVTVGGNGTLTGALIAGVNNAGKSYTLTEQNTGFNITEYGYKPVEATHTPEPSSMALLGGGLTAIAFARRRRIRQSSKT